MTARQSFRFGFLYRCAEEGLGPEAALDRAARLVEKRAWLGGLGGLATGLGGLGLAAGVGVPALVGGGVGLGLAHAQEKDDDPDEVRRQELIAAYNYHADQARRRAALQRVRVGLAG